VADPAARPPDPEGGLSGSTSSSSGMINWHTSVQETGRCSQDHQELEVVSHIRDNNMGVIVETYRTSPLDGAQPLSDPGTSTRSLTSRQGGLTASRSWPLTA
jgi:hypothetical protein